MCIKMQKQLSDNIINNVIIKPIYEARWVMLLFLNEQGNFFLNKNVIPIPIKERPKTKYQKSM